MKKKSCRMTELERQQHDRAVKVRKMTDEKLCEYLDKLAYREPEEAGPGVAEFIQLMEEKAGSGNGIGKVTVGKVKNFAVSEGFIEG